MQFSIQPDGEIPASSQLYEQLSFAITSGRYPAGAQLPSIRQLSAWTGLHRNTISKVYQQLKRSGLVTARGGSGFYVRDLENLPQVESIGMLVHRSIDQMVKQGFSLAQIRETFLTAIDWRAQCSAEILVVSGEEDRGVAEIMARELRQALPVPIQIASIEELPHLLQFSQARTIATNRYLGEQTKRAIGEHPVRLFLLDIYDYQQEIERIKKLPFGTRLGLVSPSAGILRIAENIVHSLRGEDLVVMTALPQDTYRLQAITRTAHVLIIGHGGEAEVQRAIQATRPQRLFPLEVLTCKNYLAPSSVQNLKLELGL
ncbi:MAG: GntR family transcriptional regulator [Pseudanabaenaceae cyanobacterium]